MKLNELKPVEGAKHAKKRVGRGIGSGIGKTSGRGQKGQNSRSGGGVRPGYEGGQTPLFKRLPKRGFTNIHRHEYAIVNLGDINALFEAGAVVDLEALKKVGLVKKEYEGNIFFPEYESEFETYEEVEYDEFTVKYMRRK